jgi:4-amino-4-deoxy-L-arabinose transferase-like glycosyltransferase
LTCLLAYLVGRELADERRARLAGLLTAIYLPHAYFATVFWSENLFVPCLALALWLFVRALSNQQGRGWLLALAGLALGWSALVRPFALLLVPILPLVLLRRQWREGRLRPLALLALPLAAALVVAPWTARNYSAHHRLVAIATNGGSTFYGGNNDRVISRAEPRLLGSWLSTTDLPHRDLIEAAGNEVDHDKVEWQLGLAWVKDHPGKAALLVPCKLARLVLWLPDFDGGGPAYYAGRALGCLPFLALALAGAWAGRREMGSDAWLAVHGALLTTALTAVIFWGSPRFRDANAPLLMLYAAAGLAALIKTRPAVPARVEEQPAVCTVG